MYKVDVTVDGNEQEFNFISGIHDDNYIGGLDEFLEVLDRLVDQGWIPQSDLGEFEESFDGGNFPIEFQLLNEDAHEVKFTIGDD